MGETRKMAAEKLDHLLSTAGLDEEARAHESCAIRSVLQER